MNCTVHLMECAATERQRSGIMRKTAVALSMGLEEQ